MEGKRRGRTAQEKLVDQLLLLYLIYKGFERGLITETKIQKLVFLSEWRMLSARQKGFNYNFIKLIYPTYSADVHRDLSKLIEYGAIKVPFLSSTAKAELILQEFNNVIEKNKEIVEKIDETIKEFARMPLQKLVRIVGNMPHPLYKDLSIAVVKIRTPLLRRISEERATQVFEITPVEREIFELYFSSEVLKHKVLGFDVFLLKEREGGFSVKCPALPGCVSQGENVEEAIENIKEAIQGYLECTQKHKRRQTNKSKVLSCQNCLAYLEKTLSRFLVK